MTHLLSRLTSALALLFVLVAAPAAAQNGTVSGTITVEEDGAALPGANVVALDGSGAIITGAATQLDGTYSFSIAAGSYTIRARYVGFQDCEVNITVSAGGTSTVDCALSQTGLELNTVVVAASRRQEKALDAPASISVLSAEDLQTSVGGSSVEALRTTPGVDMQQTGVDRRELVLRGFNNAFSGATYVLTDYRQAAVPSLAVNIYSIMPNIGVDVDRIEVVRGPGSALYGAGVDAGVVHFITKDPFTHPGTTISVQGGEQSMFGGQFRHAGVTSNGKLGYKITGTYLQAEDWALDPNDPHDAGQIAIDGVRNTDYMKSNVNGNLEYRYSDEGTVSANFGYSALEATVLSGVGTVQAKGYGYSYGQLRLNHGGFFSQLYLNLNNAGDSYVYGAFPVVDESTQLVGQAQYEFANRQGKQNSVIGADFEMIRPDTKGTIQTDEGIDKFGVYAQTTTDISQKLSLTTALRGDYSSVAESFEISPRAALVFKPNNAHSFRATYNRAFSSPSTNSNFLNIVAGQIPGTDIVIRGRGAADGYTWDRNPAWASTFGTDLVASSLNPAFLGNDVPIGMTLNDLYYAVWEGINAIPAPTLAAMLGQAGLPVDAQTAGTLQFLLSPANGTNVEGASLGLLAFLNTSTGSVEVSPVRDLQNVDPLKQTITNTVEFGYKGIINDNFLVTADFYYTKRDNFVGPLLMETPFVIVPNLANDLTAAIARGIAGNATLAGALGQFGVSSEQAAALITQLAADQLPSASTPVAIVQPLENNNGSGSTPELMLTYRNFGKVSFYGSDIALQYLANENLSLFGNLSMVSDDYFDESELDEKGSGLKLALNAPSLKGSAGFNYDMDSGLSVNAAGRYTDGFPVLSGPYVGDVDSYFLLDVGAGYDLTRIQPGLRIDLQVSNVLDNMHREFIGAPQMGRMGVARLTYSIQ